MTKDKGTLCPSVVPWQRDCVEGTKVAGSEGYCCKRDSLGLFPLSGWTSISLVNVGL